MFWDSRAAGTAARSGEPFTGLGSDHVTEQLDWLVVVRVAVYCRRRYRRDCGCPVPATVTAPGPPKAIGKGLFSNGLLAMLFTERFVAGEHELAGDGAGQAGRGHRGGDAGRGLRAGRGAARAAGGGHRRAVAGPWHLHADETSWRVFAPRDGDGPAKWWLWVFLGRTPVLRYGPDEVRAVLARHAGIDEDTGELAADPGGGPRRLVISATSTLFTSPRGRRRTGW